MAEENKNNRKFEVLFSGITDATGQMRKQGEILTAEELSNIDLHLSRGAIREVEASEAAAPESPGGSEPPKTPKGKSDGKTEGKPQGKPEQK